MPIQVGLSYLLGILLTFLVWTLCLYVMHRLSHIPHKYNPLWQLHRAHHRIPYLSTPSGSVWPQFGQFFLWLGNWRASLDVIVSMTLPAIALAIAVPKYGVPVLVLHYFYEIFLSEYALDHNPRIQGAVTRYWACGDYHLHHHAHPARNFGLMLTLWDRVFGSAFDPQPGAALARQQKLITARALTQ